MKKNYVEGLNGSIEVKKRYICLFLENEKDYYKKGHIIWYEELEDIAYKKPTKSKYGYITLFLNTKKFIGNETIKYTLILDKINEINIDNSELIYNLLDEIVSSNHDIKIEYISDNEIDEEKYYSNDTYQNEEKKEENNKDKNINNNDNNLITKRPQNIVNSSTITEKKSVENQVTSNKQEKQTFFQEKEINETTSQKKKTSNNTYFNNEDKLKSEKERQNNLFQNEINKSNNDLNQSIKEDKNLVTIDSLEQKLNDLEKDLNIIAYKEMILNKYTDETKEKEEIENLILEIQSLIDQLEKIKKEISSQERNLSQNDFLSLLDGKVIITNISSKIYDKKEKERLESYISTYKDTIKKIEIIDKEIKELNNLADSKKEEINISDKEYEKDINMLKNVKTTKEFIEKYRKEAEENIRKVRHDIKTIVEEKSRFRMVKKEVSNQTKILSSIIAINALRKPRSRAATFALSLYLGVVSLGSMFNYDMKEEHYNEITQIDTLIGLENVDTEKARSLIIDSKSELEKIIKDCEYKYSSYPQFNELKSELLDIKNDIEKEEQELKELEDEMEKYRREEKVKILKYEQ